MESLGQNQQADMEEFYGNRAGIGLVDHHRTTPLHELM